MKTKTAPKKMTEKELLAKRERLEELNQQIETAKAEAGEIKEAIVKAFFPADKEEGTKTVTEYGIKMELGKPLNYSISYADAELFFQTHPDIANDCLGWSPRVKAAGFRNHIKEIGQFVTVSPGSVTVSFK